MISGGIVVSVFVIAMLELAREVSEEEKTQLEVLDIAHITPGIGLLVLAALVGRLIPVGFFALCLAILSVPVGLQLLFTESEDTSGGMDTA